MKTTLRRCSSTLLLATAFAFTWAGVRPADLRAAVVSYTNESAFVAAAGPHGLIRFNELPPGTVVSDQYASWGVVFTDGNYTTDNSRPSAYPRDGFGLVGSWPQYPNNRMVLQFLSPELLT